MNNTDWRKAINLAKKTNARLKKEIAYQNLPELCNRFTGFNIDGDLVVTDVEGQTVNHGLKIDNGILEYRFDNGQYKSVSAFSKSNSEYEDVIWLVNKLLEWRRK